MVSNSSVTAIKGNQITGVAYLKAGGFSGAIDIDSDFDELGFTEFAIVSSEDGIAFSRSADSNEIKAWGDITIDEFWSNNSATITVNIISFKDVNSLKALFGSANVVKRADGVIEVSIKAISASEHVAIAILGVDKNGKDAILYARDAAIDPNFEFTWNDADPVAIPAVFKLFTDKATQELGKMLLDDAPIPAPVA